MVDLMGQYSKIKNEIDANIISCIESGRFVNGPIVKDFSENLANYLKTIKLPKYGIWAMTKNKEPDLFIRQLRGIFKKIVTMPIENEKSSVSAKELYKIAIKNKFNSFCKRKYFHSNLFMGI